MSARKVPAALALALMLVLGGSFLGGGLPRVEAACTISASLRLGSSGEPVRCLQTTLNAPGYNSGPVDGRFGPMTYRAVVRYQAAKRLYVDGVVGRQTVRRSGCGAPRPPVARRPRARRLAPPPRAAPRHPPERPGARSPPRCAAGHRVPRCSCLQSRLTALGYPVGPLDGAFGKMTHNGVVRYQRAKGLFVDGIVGRITGTSLGIWGTAASGGGAPAAPASQCTPPSGVPTAARQVVVVNSSGSVADVDLLVNSGGRWTCSRMDMPGRVGRNGVRTLANRRSGDGTTPGGVFPLASMTAPDGQTFQFFGNGVNPGVQGSWRQVRAGDCWGATPNTADYNRLVTRTAANCQSPDEYLINFQQAYSRAALIGANLGPNRSGDAPGEAPLAAAIFLHRHSYDAAGNSRATSGCVSLNNTNLIYVLQRLVPGQAYFVIR